MIFASEFSWLDPDTWPFITYWMIFVGLIALARFLWSKNKQEQIRQWPAVMATIVSVAVEEKAWRGKYAAPLYAEIKYEYLYGSKRNTGSFKEDADSVEEGEEFVRGLLGNEVKVSVDPDNPSTSVLGVETLQALKDTIPPSTYRKPENPILSCLTWPAMIFSICGFLLSSAAHLTALSGKSLLPEIMFWPLTIGMFIACFAAILVFKNAKKRFGKNRKNLSQDWANGAMVFLVAYTMVNSFITSSEVPRSSRIRSGDEVTIGHWRNFSGFWMLFYGVSTIMLSDSALASRAKNADKPDL